MIENDMKFASVCMVGLPNAGKSTLFNILLDQYIAPVTHKAQTTIDEKMYVLTEGDIQIALYDLPGMIHNGLNKLRGYFNKIIRSVVSQSDIILVVFDLSYGLIADEEKLLLRIEQMRTPAQQIIIVLNKFDIIKSHNEHKIIHYQKLYKHVLITSYKKASILKSYLVHIIPESEWKYDIKYTGLHLKDWTCEITRKFLLERFHEEIPYNLSVSIIKFDESDTDIVIHQSISFYRASYKHILLGEKGHIMKTISQKSRSIISNYTGKQIHLFLHLKLASIA